MQAEFLHKQHKQNCYNNQWGSICDYHTTCSECWPNKFSKYLNSSPTLAYCTMSVLTPTPLITVVLHRYVVFTQQDAIDLFNRCVTLLFILHLACGTGCNSRTNTYTRSWCPVHGLYWRMIEAQQFVVCGFLPHTANCSLLSVSSILRALQDQHPDAKRRIPNLPSLPTPATPRTCSSMILSAWAWLSMSVKVWFSQGWCEGVLEKQFIQKDIE